MGSPNKASKPHPLQTANSEPTYGGPKHLGNVASASDSKAKQGQGQIFQATEQASSYEAPFEEIDLTGPPNEPSFEVIDHADASHSSYNSQPDHMRKYKADSQKNFSKNEPYFTPTKDRKWEAQGKCESKK